MQVKTKYIIFVSSLLLVTETLLYIVFSGNKLLFIISEVFAVVAAAIAWQLYRQLIRPLKMLMQSAETIKDKDFNVTFLPTGNRDMDKLITVFNHMMNELRMERTKQEQQHFFLDKLIQTSPTGIVILDFDNNIQEINQTASRILGIYGGAFTATQLNETSRLMLDQISKLHSGQTTIVKLRGVNTYKVQKSHFVHRGVSRHFIMIEELTTEMMAAEKSVYEKVIRMMAHEVNNTIGPVNSIMQTVLMSGRLWENQQQENLKNALQIAIDRNQNLNLFMRNFAELVKLPPPNRQRVDLHQLVESVLSFMSIRAGEKGVAFIKQLPNEPFMVMADVQQMEHALINIIKNGIEAIEQPGHITVTSIPSERRLVIADSGKGISPEQAPNLFSPFFSTKKDGQGIGLTLVREIFLSHHFEFSLQTVAEKRTEFSISLNYE